MTKLLMILNKKVKNTSGMRLFIGYAQLDFFDRVIIQCEKNAKCFEIESKYQHQLESCV